MQNEQLLILGQTNYRNVRKRFGIKAVDRRRPTYIVGKTGMGKSTLLLNCIVQDIRFGNGVAVIDPHGDLVERVLEYVPSHRVNETIYFNPADTEYPIAFNMLSNADSAQRALVASGIIQVFKKIWSDSWGPRLEYVLRNTLLALQECPGSTLLGVLRMLSEERYRARIIRAVRDPIVRHFWTMEFEQYPKVFRTETISPIQNKIGQFLANPITRNILGQTKTKFDLRNALDTGKILLVNLSKGKIGEDTSSLLGALMLTQVYLAALSRAQLTEVSRRDFYVYADEIQSFATEDLPSMLSEARKYHLYFAGIANQFIAQLPKHFVSAILGNAGTIIAFATGSEDAELLRKEFAPTFDAIDLQSLSQYSVYLKLSIDGKTSPPFSAETLPPSTPPPQSNRAKLIAQSRQRYARGILEVNGDIEKWLSN